MNANVEAAELKKFSDAAHGWWDEDGEFRTLHQMNPLRMQWIEGLSPLRGRRVLDIGCGGGILSESLAAAGADVTGIDLAGKSLRVARLHALQGGQTIDYREIAAESLAAAEPAGFDIVCCMEMLEHVPDPRSIVRAAADLVRPGGWVFFSTVNRSFKSYALAIVAAEYLLRLIPRGTHDWAKFIRPGELAAWARGAGLDPIEFKGLEVNPLNHSFKLGRSVDVNYFLACRKSA
jgi:2-polyprenyl-6-hydroxyphenyl methylase/3-demethylubiquinone-9 3-methyltransferase